MSSSWPSKRRQIAEWANSILPGGSKTDPAHTAPRISRSGRFSLMLANLFSWERGTEERSFTLSPFTWWKASSSTPKGPPSTPTGSSGASTVSPGASTGSSCASTPPSTVSLPPSLPHQDLGPPFSFDVDIAFAAAEARHAGL